MRQLMQQRERPCGTRVQIVYDNERRDIVCEREAAKNFHVQRGMMTAEIAGEKNKHPDRFGLRAQKRKGFVRIGGGAQFERIDADRSSDRRDQGGNAVRHSRGTDNRQRRGFLRVNENRPDHFLARLQVAEKRVGEGADVVLPSGRQGAEILSAVACDWRRGQIESYKRAAILLRHPRELRPRWRRFAQFELCEALFARNASSLFEIDLPRRQIKRQPGRLASPAQKIGVDVEIMAYASTNQ